MNNKRQISLPTSIPTAYARGLTNAEVDKMDQVILQMQFAEDAFNNALAYLRTNLSHLFASLEEMEHYIEELIYMRLDDRLFFKIFPDEYEVLRDRVLELEGSTLLQKKSSSGLQSLISNAPPTLMSDIADYAGMTVPGETKVVIPFPTRREEL